MFYSLLSATALSLAAIASAETHQISAGKGGRFAFDPSEITAAVGDTLVFRFYNPSGPHNVVSGDFSSPCLPRTGAFYSGDIQGDSDGEARFTVEVTSTDPIYFYCSVARHCQGGMVGVVNAPSGQGYQAYKTKAQTVTSADEPDAVAGGTLSSGGGDDDDDDDESSSSSSRSATASSTESASGTSGPASASQTAGSTTGITGLPTSTGNAGVAGAGTVTSTPGATTTPNVGNGGRHSEGMVLGGVAALLGGFVALMA